MDINLDNLWEWKYAHIGIFLALHLTKFRVPKSFQIEDLLRDMLYANVPFKWCHTIKFESLSYWLACFNLVLSSTHSTFIEYEAELDYFIYEKRITPYNNIFSPQSVLTLSPSFPLPNPTIFSWCTRECNVEGVWKEKIQGERLGMQNLLQCAMMNFLRIRMTMIGHHRSGAYPEIMKEKGCWLLSSLTCG